MSDPLLAKVLSGEAAPAELERFHAALAADPELAAGYERHRRLEGMLGVALEDEGARATRRAVVMEALRAVERRDFVDQVKLRIVRTRRVRGVRRTLAVAAAITLLLAGGFVFRPREVVASVVRVESVTWGGGGALEPGDKLRLGQVLEFPQGLIELEIGRKGRMVVEGPALLTLSGPERSRLERGRVVMRVTPEGHGYRMDTPDGRLIDHGTEFGVSVSDSGKSEIHVLEGEVEAAPRGGGKVILRQAEAIRFANGGERIPADEAGFYTRLPPLRQDAGHFIHWPLDVALGGSTPAIENGLADGGGGMRLLAMAPGSPPRWTEAVYGGGLEFDGTGAYGESDFKGIGGGHPRTVCFWTKVPEDFSPREGFALISWGRFRDDLPGFSWQIAINPIDYDGPIGCLRVGTHKGNIVGTTDLTDGKWHHVAVVMYGGSQVNVGTHVLVYIDGKLEPISRRALQEVRTEIATAGHGVWLGRNLTYGGNAPDHTHGGFFRGGLDEVYIFDSALSRDEVRVLRDHNAPP